MMTDLNLVPDRGRRVGWMHRDAASSLARKGFGRIPAGRPAPPERKSAPGAVKPAHHVVQGWRE
jgi:hypothetical protein